MPIRVIVHIHNEDPFLAEVEDLPDPHDNFVRIRNPRKRDGRHSRSSPTVQRRSSTLGRESRLSK